MTPDEATNLLNLDEAVVHTPNAIRAAWAKEVHHAHPDTGGDSEQAASLIKKLTTARDLLLRSVETRNNACALCRGVGSVRGAMGVQVCTACKGSGERQ